MTAQAFIENLGSKIGVGFGGANPWDIQVNNPRIFDRLMAEGSLGFGESYMDGDWDCRQLDELFNRIVGARLDKEIRVTPNLLFLILRSKLQNMQHPGRVWQAADVHYNLPVKVFECTFDSRLTGSCGYWAGANDLDTAQEAKLDLIYRKLHIQPGERPRIWDIGCGWGAFMGYVAERHGANCVGVTISEEQVKYAKERYKNLPADFRLQDYRKFDEKVDHIVSMGMFEHVGYKNYRTYFETARRAIKDDGLFVLHTIWANNESSHIDPWIDKYIFPNGVLPTIEQVAKACEGLFVIEDVHNFGTYYDRTLMAWNDKFQTHRKELAAELGEKFCRMWEYYLLCCAGGFRSRGISVGQFVLSPKGVKGVYEAVR
jgi:cyclopropane-fatty-acyl-phospholipid synthase